MRLSPVQTALLSASVLLDPSKAPIEALATTGGYGAYERLRDTYDQLSHCLAQDLRLSRAGSPNGVPQAVAVLVQRLRELAASHVDLLARSAKSLIDLPPLYKELFVPPDSPL